MITDRPTHASPPRVTALRPCDACGAPVDALRAPFVAHIDDAFRYFCSAECHARRFEPRIERPSVMAAARMAASVGEGRPSIEQMADMLGLPRASLPPGVLEPATVSVGMRETPAPPRSSTPEAPLEPSVQPLLLSAGAALAAQFANAFTASTATLALAALFTLVAFAGTVASLARVRRNPEGILVWASSLVAPLALVVTALRATETSDTVARLTAAATIAATVAFTVWITQTRRAHARDALVALARAIPASARVVRGETIERVEASRVRAGEEVQVDAGEQVPVDGVVQSSDHARVCHIGGEARSCAAGVPVLAGAKVIEGSLRVLATRSGDDVALARMQRLGESGSTVPRTLVFADRISQFMPWFTAAIGALGTALASMSGTESPTLLWLVIASSPAALGAALARVAYVDATRRAAERGIVFRDAAAIEAAAGVHVVVLATRGTVTHGAPELVDVVSLGDLSERALLGIAASAEDASPDEPLARAALFAARARGIEIEPARRPTSVNGRGITAVSAGGESIAVGSRRLMLEEGIGVASGEDVARMIEYQGRTAVFVSIAGRVEGVLGFDDPIRDEARPAVQTLIDAGFELVLLAGMGRGTLEALGERLDVVNVRPEVLPEERGAAVLALREAGQRVAVIGRPPKDSAALGEATIAISLAAAGAAVGETSVALAGDDLRDAAAALAIAREGRERAVRVIVASVGGSLVASLLVALVPAAGVMGAAVGAVLVTLGALLATR